MSNPLISVIVPVYKAEAYLERCISSIRNQTYTNLEIILVDDGSPDRSGEMCDAFAKEDSRIRVFHKENGGQSSARNLGLDHMTGEYIAFVDSDDWIETEMYERLYELIKTYQVKIACCGIQTDFLDGKIGYFNHAYPNDKTVRIFERMDALRDIMHNARVTYSPCDKLFHRDIFADIRMTVGRINEDTEILPKCVELADRIVYDPHPFYHYTMTQQSTTRGTFQVRNFAEADVTLEKAEDYRVRYPQLYDAAMAEYYTVCLTIIYRSAKSPSCAQRRKELIRELRGPLCQGAVAAMRKNDRIKLKVLRIHPVLYECMMRLYRLLNR